MGSSEYGVQGEDVGKVIETARYRQGSTQREVAEKLGVHWVTISKLERGVIPMTREWAERLASVLPLDFDDLDPQKGRKSGYLLAGTLNDWGSISLTEGKRAFDGAEHLNTKGRWFQINSHLFGPVLNKGDIVRISDIGDRDPKECAQGRFCLVESNDSTDMYFGVYTFSPSLFRQDKVPTPSIVCPFFYETVPNLRRMIPDTVVQEVPSPLEMPFKVVGVVSQIIIPAIRPDLTGAGKTVFWE